MLFRSNDTATTEIYTSSYTLSLHDALPILSGLRGDAGNRDNTGSGLDEVPRADGRLNECVNRVKNWLLASAMGSGDCVSVHIQWTFSEQTF